MSGRSVERDPADQTKGKEKAENPMEKKKKKKNTYIEQTVNSVGCSYRHV